MKDGLGSSAVERIIQSLIAAGADISAAKFRQDSLNTLEQLELKDRVRHLISVMAAHLPDSFSETAAILGRIRDHWTDGEEDDQFQIFAAWPIIDYVGQHGVEHPNIALPLLRYLTSMFSAEFAVRPFLEKHPKVAYSTMLKWCHDPDEHVRRLASKVSVHACRGANSYLAISPIPPQ